MSRVVILQPRGALRAALLAAFLVVSGLPSVMPAVAQDGPTCVVGEAVSDCILPGWPEASLQESPSLFGLADDGAWVIDDAADTAANGLDILSVGVAPVRISNAGDIRKSPDLLTAGKPGKAVRGGQAVLIRVVLDRPATAIEGGHAGVHIATDIDGARSNNAPIGVGKPEGPFAGSQDVYSLTYATTTDTTKLLDSNLAKGWYKDNDPFAASWAAPNVLDVLVPARAFGEGLKVITFVSGADGGYDTVALGPGAIPVDGEVGLLPVCTEAAISNEPFTVRRLVENGQTLRDIEAPASWHGGAAIPLDDDSRAALEAYISANDDDGDGQVTLPSSVSIFEDGLVIRQRPAVELALHGETAQLALQLGLTKRGYNVIRAIDIAPTGDAEVDAYLERASRSLVQNTPSFRSNKKSGLLEGTGIGACVSQLIATPSAEQNDEEVAASA